MGKRLYPSDFTLPVSTSGRKMGYHAQQITHESHHLYEEVPCLGIIGDMLMAATSVQPNPNPNIPGVPANAAPTTNLLGFSRPLPPRRIELQQLWDI